MRFAQSHEWIDLSEDIGTVGISNFASKELGEIVYLALPQIGQRVEMGKEVVVLESTKAAVDIYSPVSGEIIAVNETLKERVDLLNRASETEGWLFKIRVENSDELKNLMSREQYEMVVS
jgi:glycine cleavage system H protein